MTIFELDSLRAELARKALVSEDEALLKKALKLFSKPKKDMSKISGLTYEREEQIRELKEAVAEYRSGKSVGLTSDELDEEMKSW